MILSRRKVDNTSKYTYQGEVRTRDHQRKETSYYLDIYCPMESEIRFRMWTFETPLSDADRL